MVWWKAMHTVGSSLQDFLWVWTGFSPYNIMFLNITIRKDTCTWRVLSSPDDHCMWFQACWSQTWVEKKNYQAKLFWTVIIDNYCTLYIVAVISKTKVGILTMWPFLKTKSLKGPMTPLLWHVGNIVLDFLLVLYTPADVNLNICKECSSHLEVANIAIAYDLKWSGCWAK